VIGKIDFTYKYIDIPLVMYRYDVGISKNKKRLKNTSQEYDREIIEFRLEHKIIKKNKAERNLYLKYLNPYNYYMRLKRFIIDKSKKHLDLKKHVYEYYSLIKDNVQNYKENSNEEYSN
jgi:hypothetical protein